MPAGDGKVPFLHPMNPDMPWFTMGDFDSFLALFFDNLSTLLGVMTVMATEVPLYIVHLDPEYLKEYRKMCYNKVLPGTAMGMAFGNIWYAWMARKLAGYEHRTNVTAQPYGLNTPAAFSICYSVMQPLCFKNMVFSPAAGKLVPKKNPAEFATLVWEGACSVVFVCGIIEAAGCLVGEPVRKNMSIAALMTPIASIGFVWLGFSPLVKIMAEPVVGFLPYGFAIIGYFGGCVMKLGRVRIPVAIWVILSGAIVYWAGDSGCGQDSPIPVEVPSEGEYEYCGRAAAHKHNLAQSKDFMWKNQMEPFVSLNGMSEIKNYIGIVTPIALQSFIETMECTTSAMVAGDHYPLNEAMVADGLGTMVAAIFGSVLPTTVYIGHPYHKHNGASAGYSLLNAAAFFFMLMSGLFPFIEALVPLEATGAILVFVGTMIAQQSFKMAPVRHYPAVCIGLMFAIADYVRLNGHGQVYGLPWWKAPGIINMGLGGGIMASFLFTQITCDMIDRRFLRGGLFCIICVFFSLFGLMHANNLDGPNNNKRPSEVHVSTRGSDYVEQGEMTISVRSKVNDGWRFSCAYFMLGCLNFVHFGFQKAGLIEEELILEAELHLSTEVPRRPSYYGQPVDEDLNKRPSNYDAGSVPRRASYYGTPVEAFEQKNPMDELAAPPAGTDMT